MLKDKDGLGGFFVCYLTCRGTYVRNLVSTEAVILSSHCLILGAGFHKHTFLPGDLNALFFLSR